jgi:hypothetical protein
MGRAAASSEPNATNSTIGREHHAEELQQSDFGDGEPSDDDSGRSCCDRGLCVESLDALDQRLDVAERNVLGRLAELDAGVGRPPVSAHLLCGRPVTVERRRDCGDGRQLLELREQRLHSGTGVGVDRGATVDPPHQEIGVARALGERLLNEVGCALRVSARDGELVAQVGSHTNRGRLGAEDERDPHPDHQPPAANECASEPSHAHSLTSAR